ncbi:MAG TPA: hypothetical protein PLI45_04735 [Candidatus Woesebacteria bacterium]|nr:hypothetical protein [Candidatus Woesebacteria bacterium]
MDHYHLVLYFCHDSRALASAICEKLQIALPNQSENLSPNFIKYKEKFLDENARYEAQQRAYEMMCKQASEDKNIDEYLVLLPIIKDRSPHAFEDMCLIAIEVAKSFDQVSKIIDLCRKTVVTTAGLSKMTKIGTLEDWFNVYTSPQTGISVRDTAFIQISHLIAKESKKFPIDLTKLKKYLSEKDTTRSWIIIGSQDDARCARLDIYRNTKGTKRLLVIYTPDWGISEKNPRVDVYPHAATQEEIDLIVKMINNFDPNIKVNVTTSEIGL